MVDYYETSPQGFLPLRARLPAASQSSRHRSRSLHGGAARARGEQRRWSLAMPPAALASEPAEIPRGRTAGSRAADSGTSVWRARMPFDHSPVTDREVRRSTPSRRATQDALLAYLLAAGGVPWHCCCRCAWNSDVAPRNAAGPRVRASRPIVSTTIYRIFSLYNIIIINERCEKSKKLCLIQDSVLTREPMH